MKLVLKKLVLAFSVLLISPLAFSQTPQCHKLNDAGVTALFTEWNNSLQTNDPKKVVANYATQSVLVPTQSNDIRITPAEKENYFAHFLAKRPVGTINNSHIEKGCNIAVNSGIYTFKFNDGSSVQARYTFVYEWEGKNKKWLITTHHSSPMPEPVNKS